MSETPKDIFWKKAATTAAGVALVGVTGAAVGIHTGINNSAENLTEHTQEQNTTIEIDTIKQAIEASYDEKQLVDRFTADESNYDRIYETADKLLETTLGEAYTANHDRLQQPLLLSAQQFGASVQLNDVFYIVEADIDGNPENGNEYIVTKKAPIVDELPQIQLSQSGGEPEGPTTDGVAPEKPPTDPAYVYVEGEDPLDGTPAPLIRIKVGSPEWFAYIEEHPEFDPVPPSS